MIVNSRLLGGAEGESALADYVGDKRLSALYEKFVLEYFRREHPDLQASSKYVQSVVENEPAFLPKLHTDVTLASGNHELIIDCKCYGTILHAHMDKEILAPPHRNQIYTYVMHESFANQKLNVEGMLLYALTEKESAMHETWTETGHNFHCFTLDLGKDFKSIAAELDTIADMVRDKSHE
jgi:5-methylcytosine-specific restriction enzyme subunit McrC